jgi:hypothetical protein
METDKYFLYNVEGMMRRGCEEARYYQTTKQAINIHIRMYHKKHLRILQKTQTETHTYTHIHTRTDTHTHTHDVLEMHMRFISDIFPPY